MPIKKDGTGKRWVEMEILVAGTPEEVWQAMATGAGYTGWFTKAVVEEQVGGVIRFIFAPGMESSGEVTEWEPPLKFGYVEKEWCEGAPPVVTEIVITPRAGGKCVVRMVHSLFASKDDWDDQMEGFESGWPGFFEVLRVYLAHFKGMKTAHFQVMHSVKGDQLEAWRKLIEKMGLVAVNCGEKRSVSAGIERLSGTVEHTLQHSKMRMILLRLEEPGPGALLLGTYGMGDEVNVSVSMYLYGDDAEERAKVSEEKVREWMGQTFPVEEGMAREAGPPFVGPP